MNQNNAGALPGCLFVPGSSMVFPFPITMDEGETVILPGDTPGQPAHALDISGWNTLSWFVTFSFLPAGNDFVLTLSTYDPQTGAVLVGGLGDLELTTQSADGNYAGTVYLPSYYASIAGKVMPFFQNVFQFTNDGATPGTMQVDAFKVWLSNA